MSHMTKVEGVPDCSEVKPGMAYFENTGPFCRTCGECKHKGYHRQSSREHFNPQTGEWFTRSYKVQACAMFRKLTGNHGPAVESDWKACKYFDAKETEPAK